MICDFCYRRCSISEGKTGYCKARTVRNGRLEDVSYGRLASAAVDPVEKKPLYHFLPGTETLSVAMEGCSFSCDFCQNHEIAKARHEGLPFFSPEDIVEKALHLSLPSLSFTYTEPLVWQDYMAHCAEHAKEHGLKTIMVTNGGFSAEALERLLPLVDAYNVDLKGDENFYRTVCHASLTPVLDAVEAIARHGAHLEVTTLVIEGLHDRGMIRNIGRELKMRGVHVWHLTRFFPAFRMMNRKPTSELFLSEMIEAAADSEIEFIYPGNSICTPKTKCPECGHLVLNGICGNCGRRIYGVWA